MEIIPQKRYFVVNYGKERCASVWGHRGAGENGNQRLLV